MDDVDAVQAQIARNMLTSNDWVTARLDGVPYLEKAPLIYWMMALSYEVFGVHDWAARLPLAISAVILCWVVYRFSRWAFDEEAGLYAGIALATSAGLFLFTRILLPDATLTLTITGAIWACLLLLEPEGDHPRRWSVILGVCLGTGLLLKGLIAVVFPMIAVLAYMAVTRQLSFCRSKCRSNLGLAAVVALTIAVPWHVLAILNNPPYFAASMHSGPGEYHGFFWFYFINEHVLRFLNLRYPRDYNTVPRVAFWLLHLLWLFPWSAFFPAVAGLHFQPVDRAGRTRLLALCWTGFLLVFFTFSTTQEYYSMPVYPALALLLGSAMSGESNWLRMGTRALGVVSGLAFLVILAILYAVRGVATPGDISNALQQHPEAYTLSLGHLGDLTISSFAYLRVPLMVAGAAFLVGALSSWLLKGRRAFLGFAVMMVVFLHASRLALVRFDPYLSSRPLAEALLHAPEGRLILNGQYYSFSSVFFYTGKTALLLHGRVNNLEYGSYAPGSPGVFIDDPEFVALWSKPERFYVLSDHEDVPHLTALVDGRPLQKIAESGGKLLFANQP
jgi:hypothetical protein